MAKLSDVTAQSQALGTWLSDYLVDNPQLPSFHRAQLERVRWQLGQVTHALFVERHLLVSLYHAATNLTSRNIGGPMEVQCKQILKQIQETLGDDLSE